MFSAGSLTTQDIYSSVAERKRFTNRWIRSHSFNDTAESTAFGYPKFANYYLGEYTKPYSKRL
jgi:hypothetical protein